MGTGDSLNATLHRGTQLLIAGGQRLPEPEPVRLRLLRDAVFCEETYTALPFIVTYGPAALCVAGWVVAGFS